MVPSWVTWHYQTSPHDHSSSCRTIRGASPLTFSEICIALLHGYHLSSCEAAPRRGVMRLGSPPPRPMPRPRSPRHWRDEEARFLPACFTPDPLPVFSRASRCCRRKLRGLQRPTRVFSHARPPGSAARADRFGAPGSALFVPRSPRCALHRVDAAP